MCSIQKETYGIITMSIQNMNEMCMVFIQQQINCILILIEHERKKAILPVTGFPLASVTATDWTDSVTGLPLAS